MISNQAKRGFDSLLTRSLIGGLSSNHLYEIDAVEQLPAIEKHEAVVLTVSSYTFRLLMMIHFNAGGAARDYMARQHGMEAIEDQAFYDAVAELGNLSCGILNRDLGTYFPHLGMSTPNYVGGQCMNYLTMLDSAHVQHFDVKLHGESIFHASLCIKAYEEIHFEVNEKEESVDTGELELF